VRWSSQGERGWRGNGCVEVGNNRTVVPGLRSIAVVRLAGVAER